MHRPAPPDHYALLGIRRTATQQEVKRVYRDLAKRYHPDVDPSPQAAERFMAVHTAYSTLHDPLLRLAYDASLRDQARGPVRRDAQRPQAAPPRYRQREAEVGPDIRTRSWAFIGLHLTGLLFGTLLVLTILAGIVYRDWPWAWILFITPGVIVIPDAWDGLRLAMRAKGTAATK